MTDNKLTKQTVLDNLKGEIDTLQGIQEVEDYTNSEDYREPLEIAVLKEIKILLSWGGGEDGYKLRFDSDSEFVSGVYYMADWGEYEEVELSKDEAKLVIQMYLLDSPSMYLDNK